MHCISSSSQEPVSLCYATTYRGANPPEKSFRKLNLPFDYIIMYIVLMPPGIILREV